MTPSRPLRRSVTRDPAVINLAACVLLLAQFLLGMTANLYVQIPPHHPGAHAHNFFAGIVAGLGWLIPGGSTWLAAHATLGLALVAAALVNAAGSPNIGSRGYSAASAVGALAIIGAAFNGVSFVNYGHDFSSMIMAALWAIAMACYLTCLYLTTRDHGQTASP